MRKQWRCFHCDEVFTSRRWAAEHFGADEMATPGCRLKSHEGHILTALRKAEDQLVTYRAEDSDLMRAIYSLEADHRQALIRAEEAGYNKGVEDMKAQTERAIRGCPSLDENGYICEKSAALHAIASQ